MAASSPVARNASGNDDDDDNDPSPPLTSSATFQDTLMDLGSWWCHVILTSSSSSSASSSSSENRNTTKIDLRASARRMKELEQLLQVLDPVEPGSPIYARIYCLVIWHEFLTRMLSLDGGSDRGGGSASNGGDEYDDDDDDSCDVGRRNFDALLHKLQLAYRAFFAQTTTVQAKYDEVVTLVQVHGKLACLHRAFAPEHSAGMSHQELHIILDDCSDDWGAIFGTDDDDDDVRDGIAAVPPVLAGIVDKERPGLTPEAIRRSIEDVVWGPPGGAVAATGRSFSYAELRRQLQTLLLYWCEVEVEGGRLPELVRLGYRGVGVVNRSIVDIEVGGPAVGGGGGGVVDTASVDNATRGSTPKDRREPPASDLKYSDGDTDGDGDHSTHQPGIVRKRKRRRLPCVPNDDKDPDETIALERRRELELSEKWPDDGIASASSADESEMRLRMEWPEDYSDTDLEQEEEREELEEIQRERRQRSHSPSVAVLKRLAERRLGRPSASPHAANSSSSSPSVPSRKRRSLLPSPRVSLTSAALTRKQRQRSEPLPVRRGDFLTPPEEFEDHATSNSDRNRNSNISRRATLGDGTRKRIRWEDDEDKGKERME